MSRVISSVSGKPYGSAAVFVALDHGSAEWVGIHAHAGATRFQALEPIRQSVRQHLAGSKAIDRTPALRHDHGSRYMSNHFQKELAFPGIDSSPAFRSPEGNGCAERFIPTLKENLRGVRRFKTIAELRHALLACPEIYNDTRLIERHGFLSPAEYRQRQLQPPLRQRRLQPAVPKTAGGTRPISLTRSAALQHQQQNGVEL